MHRRFPILILALAGLTLGGCTRQARKARLVRQANRDYAAGRYDQAEAEYQRALTVPPPSTDAIRQLGLLYALEGRPITAIPYLRAAAGFAPKRADVNAELAQNYLTLGAAREARDAANQALEIDPRNEEALIILAEAAQSAADADAARATIKRLEAKQGDCAGYELALATLDLRTRKGAQAEAELNRALALDPKCYRAHAELGALYAMRGDTKRAASEMRVAADMAPLRSAIRIHYIEYLGATHQSAEATRLLAALTAQAPDYIPGLVYRMKLEFYQRRFKDSQATAERILARDSRNYDALVNLAAVRSAEGDTPGAVAQLVKTANFYPRSPLVKFQLALAYLRVGEPTQAKDQLSQALVLAPTFDQAALVLAQLDLRQTDPADAVSLLEGMLPRQPRSSQTYLMLGRAYLAQKNPGLAEGVYRRMISALPKDPEGYYSLGLLLEQRGQVAQARSEFEQALEAAPTYGPALDVLINADLAEKRISAAASRVSGLLAKYPKWDVPLILQAKVDLAERRLDACEADLHRAIKLDPRSQAAYFDLARFYIATRRIAQAKANLRTLAESTHSIAAYMELGAIDQAQGGYAAAKKEYQTILAIDPHYVPALNSVAYLDVNYLGDVNEGVAMAEQARQSAPDDPNVADTFGWAQFRQGKLQQALATLEESASAAPTDATIQYHLGAVRYALGEEEPAASSLRLALAPGGRMTADDRARATKLLEVLTLDPATAGRAELDVLERRVREAPNDEIALARLGALQARFASPEEAAQTLEAALRLNPQSTPAMLPLAELDAGPLHHPDQARMLAKNAHELAPNDPHIAGVLGALLYSTGDYQWSLELLNEAVQAQPNQAALQLLIAEDQVDLGRLDDAAATLSALMGSSAGMTRERAGELAALVAAVEAGAHDPKSLAIANRVLEREPENVAAQMVRALDEEAGGRTTAAAARYAKILERDSDFSPAVRRLALIEVASADDDRKAFDLATRAYAAYPTDATVATALGIVDYRRGDNNKAALLFEESLRERPDDGETTFYLGMAEMGLKENAEAQRDLQQALSLHLPGHEAADARQALDSLSGDQGGMNKFGPDMQEIR